MRNNEDTSCECKIQQCLKDTNAITSSSSSSLLHCESNLNNSEYIWYGDCLTIYRVNGSNCIKVAVVYPHGHFWIPWNTQIPHLRKQQQQNSSWLHPIFSLKRFLCYVGWSRNFKYKTKTQDERRKYGKKTITIYYMSGYFKAFSGSKVRLIFAFIG